MLRRLFSELVVLLAAALLLGASGPTRFVFEDITAASGVRFSAENGASPQKMMIETMGSGVGALDYDRDGRTAATHLTGSFDTYGMGVAVADYTNDGYPDLVLTG
jgi:hypothetical protein